MVTWPAFHSIVRALTYYVWYRYRAVSTSPPVQGRAPALQRSCTFQAESTTFHTSDQVNRADLRTRHRFPEPTLTLLSNGSDDEDFVEAAEMPLNYGSLQGRPIQQEVSVLRGCVMYITVVRAASPADSDSSSDSFHSTVNELPPQPPLSLTHQLYHTGLQRAMQGQVLARTLR